MTTVEIPEGSGNRYRYVYEEGATVYKGPVGNAPALDEERFIQAMSEGVVLSTTCIECGSSDIVRRGKTIWCNRCKKHFSLEQFEVKPPLVADFKNQVTLPKNIKNKINDKLYPLTSHYHRAIPLDDIFESMEDNGVVPLQEDYTRWSGMLLGREGRARIEMARVFKDDVGDEEWKVIKNSILVLSWYRHDTGRYEVNAYLS